MMRKKSVRVVSCVLVSLAAYACRGAGPAGGVDVQFSLPTGPVTVAVSGKVTDAKTGEPIADALVRGHIVIWKYQGPDLFERCPTAQARTDAQGLYRLEFSTVLTTTGPMKDKDGLCVYASAPGYETQPQYPRQRVTLEQTQYDDFNFALEPGRLVKGTVVDPAGQPVAGAVIRLQGGLNGDWDFFGATGRTLADDSGKFEMWITPGRGRWLSVAKQGHGTSFFWGYLDKDDMGTLVLSPGGNIRGRVIDAAGRPVAGCEVSVRGVFCDLADRVFTDNDGYYLLQGVPGDPSIIDFCKVKNGSYTGDLGQVQVHARPDPNMPLANAPTYKLLARDGQSVIAGDLVIGRNASVAGRLAAPHHTYGLGGLLVRLDGSWGDMVEVDAEGHFQFPYVSPGKHRLTAYLPHNLRYERGIGRVDIDVKQGQPLDDVEIELEDLAELRVQYLDVDGNPLGGITAGATWSQGGEGAWTEGAKSDKEGWAVLYLYPDEVQYVRGLDLSGLLVAETSVKVEPRRSEVMGNLRIVMVPPATVRGRLMGQNGEPLAGRTVACQLDYADGTRQQQRVKTDVTGTFELARVAPGMVSLALETVPLEWSARIAGPMELEPGVTKDLGEIVLRKAALYQVSGRLVSSPTLKNLERLRIRLDLKEWQPMVPTDEQGGFVIPGVPPGRHRLTAYLPFNLRTDRGVGHVDIEVADGDLTDVKLPLETLATVNVRITDEAGDPLEGVSAAAWWTEDHTGVFTEGTRSDKQGRATLTMHPGDKQYVGAHDWENRYVLTGHHALTPEKGQVVSDLHVVMHRN